MHKLRDIGPAALSQEHSISVSVKGQCVLTLVQLRAGPRIWAADLPRSSAAVWKALLSFADPLLGPTLACVGLWGHLCFLIHSKVSEILG